MDIDTRDSEIVKALKVELALAETQAEGASEGGNVSLEMEYLAKAYGFSKSILIVQGIEKKALVQHWEYQLEQAQQEMAS